MGLNASIFDIICKVQNSSNNPKKDLAKGLFFILPFIVLNFIISLKIEPIYSFLGSFPAIRNSAFIPLLLLLLVPIGAVIMLKPVFKKDESGNRKIYFLNIIVATLLIVGFIFVFIGLGKDMYHCEIQKIENCD